MQPFSLSIISINYDWKSIPLKRLNKDAFIYIVDPSVYCQNNEKNIATVFGQYPKNINICFLVIACENRATITDDFNLSTSSHYAPTWSNSRTQSWKPHKWKAPNCESKTRKNRRFFVKWESFCNNPHAQQGKTYVWVKKMLIKPPF